MFRWSRTLVAISLLLFLCACATPQTDPDPLGGKMLDEMNAVAEDYVRLVLAVGEHDPDYVDAYYGPEEWRTDAESSASSLEEIREQGQALKRRLPGLPDDAEEMLVLRRRYLDTQIGAVVARVDMLGGKKMTFNEESKALYDAVAPSFDDDHFQQILDELETLLPGTGPVVDRYTEFRRAFIIPSEKLGAVFDTAIAECRKRTAAHIELPEGESFQVEYVTDKPWSGYNWYQGKFHSLIQVNTDLPIYIDRAVDLACHEGYPGHHAYNALLEKHMMDERGWIEFSIYPLFSPQSLIAEGTANYGIEVAFPGEQRVAYEKETLFPLAGIDPSTADRFYKIQELVGKLDHAGNNAARRYLDGEIDATQCAAHLHRYALMSPDRAEQRVKFIDRYRSYVINYNLGQDLVRNYIERSSAGDQDKMWQNFSTLISSPRLPSGLGVRL